MRNKSTEGIQSAWAGIQDSPLEIYESKNMEKINPRI